ncbi:hypothetical protein AUEXF2481DRAFT_34636 [Aureobasidium subglaciale EXF-2481]|uniref:Uncharacterized protein n=1 Tax=Aureobasidium subglaciale (strain EXF-2481) TaxID=1043005 RepID=A0A074YRR3_AURSE|nr:uncharacterized protein AUEXF2481DRAFT_34636 [Aureobasidium subglaciale EXF-2481]KER00439.1 hypothetical protein AUEXF2481DRAFT_34636 [Aureobasidium subglaciale EXF-2481]
MLCDKTPTTPEAYDTTTNDTRHDVPSHPRPYPHRRHGPEWYTTRKEGARLPSSSTCTMRHTNPHLYKKPPSPPPPFTSSFHPRLPTKSFAVGNKIEGQRS